MPVTSPVLLIVATPVDADDQGVVASAVAEPDNCVVLPTQALRVPVIVGNGFTVMTAEPVLSPIVAVQFASVKDVTVYVFVVASETENVYVEELVLMEVEVVPSEYVRFQGAVPVSAIEIVAGKFAQTVVDPLITLVGLGLTVSVTSFEVTAGVQLPLTISWYL